MTQMVSKYVRFEHAGTVSHGILEGDRVLRISGGLFGDGAATGREIDIGDVRLLTPCEPSKILAVGLNYKSHLGSRPAPARPELFWKPTSCLLEPGGRIVFPEGATNVHYEGELVLVIGRRTKDVTPEEAAGCIFGYTCGIDVSEREWQKNDLQWWRAKGSDTFGPLGPAIAVGLDCRASRLQTRVNGEVKQSQSLSDLIFDPATVVSHASRCVTLLPGDVIYTGTPGTTSALKPGDVVEVEIDGIGILKNSVAE
ncbi:MAG: fumarylacetoacetate hydrolase family protein [Desulfobacterales bacterium]|jgi:2-keto-4-pentenoate hydratase/2-oxohepta-3-ene-1,7-dioic acid hydratase in catechol pathway|nr:fumarylacetoacetate hydrolase family protein [Desulfobacterales bacterium]